jgi:CheY-like chemotaxis protein
MHVTEPFARRPLQILHLEDTETDRELIRYHLQSDGLRCDFTYVDTKADFEAALTSRRFDLILSDFTVPGYHGSTALEFAHARCPETPYVFVSGTIGEDRAIESLKAGATDYILKERLDRLVPAVKRALREANDRVKHREVIDELRASEERFREMAETIHDVFWTATTDLRRYLYVSPAYGSLWQRPIDPLYNTANAWLEAVLDLDRPRLIAARAGLAAGAPFRAGACRTPWSCRSSARISCTRIIRNTGHLRRPARRSNAAYT